ncbi:MAG: Type 1 glutamine amidotransferase-like domain-containing protein [Bacteroides sp.]|nr:Type 1 glutamine amidotransferase-like domain-containing protein [Bacteroides sp.]
MKTFLTSYLYGTKNTLKEFLYGSEFNDIVFIPTASNVEEYDGYVHEAIDVFKGLNYNISILDIANTEREKIIETLKDCKCLYVSGGNTFFLLQELYRKEILDYIREKVYEGMTYIGESAGAMICSKNIEYVELMDDKTLAPELTQYEGLGIIDFYVVPHFKEYPFEKSSQAIIDKYKDLLDLLPLNNSEAVININKTQTIRKESSYVG